MIKDGIHVVGIDDAPHQRDDESTDIVLVFCEGLFLENVSIRKIDVDGLNVTDILIDELSDKIEHFQMVVTHSITFGGFNLLDIDKLHKIICKPIIAVTENKPDQTKFQDALKNLTEFQKRSMILQNAGPFYEIKPSVGENPIFFYKKGMEINDAEQFLKKFSVRSRLPEQVLLAHKIASGIN